MTARPPLIRTDLSNPFAHNTMKVRVPTTTRDVIRLNPDYRPEILADLARLAEDIENDALIPPLTQPAPDLDLWAANIASHAGHTWQQTDWFFAEIYFYRLLIEKVRWFETYRDPFAPKKAAELASPELWQLLDKALNLPEAPPEEHLSRLIYSALWGNRIDLSFSASLAHGSSGSHDDVVADDSKQAVRNLLNNNGDVHIIADNTGTELTMDLVLTDALIHQFGRNVVVHVKKHPTFVSDAIVADALALIEAMGKHGGAAAALSKRLIAAIEKGSLHFIEDFYWNSSDLLWDMPERLIPVFRGLGLVIIKGDANYRRMVGDAVWPPETPFSEVTAYFPAPLLALRTLKSDSVVGLKPGLAEELDQLDANWRVNGRRGVIQYRRGVSTE